MKFTLENLEIKYFGKPINVIYNRLAMKFVVWTKNIH